MAEGPKLHQFTTAEDTVIEPTSDMEVEVSFPGEAGEGEVEEEEEEEEEERQGTSDLPLSKVKKIFKVDPEHLGASEAAVFATAVATELFIQYFTEQASLIARIDKRKKLQYKDFSAAVSGIDQLQFLNDTVPQTHNLKGLVEKNKVRYKKDPSPLEKNQQTLRLKKRQQQTDPTELSEADDLGDLNNAGNTDNETDEDHDVLMG